LEVMLKDTIGQVKAKVGEKSGTPADRICLRFEERELLNTESVEHYGIKHETTLLMTVAQENEMEVLVDFGGEKIPFHIVSTYSVLSFKSEIDRSLDIPPERQQLMYKNKILDVEDATLDECNIVKNCTVQLLEIMQIIVMDKRKMQIRVLSNYTLLQVKKEIEKLNQMPPDTQSIIYLDKTYAGKDSDKLTVKALQLTSGCTITVAKILPGGS